MGNGLDALPRFSSALQRAMSPGLLGSLWSLPAGVQTSLVGAHPEVSRAAGHWCGAVEAAAHTAEGLHGK